MPRGKPGVPWSPLMTTSVLSSSPRLLEFLQQHADVGVARLRLAQVVGEVLADFGHVGQERRQLALQRVGIDVPQRLAASPSPTADACWSGRTSTATVDLSCGRPGRRRSCRAPRRGFCSCAACFVIPPVTSLVTFSEKLLSPIAGLLVGVLLPAEGGVGRRAGAPDLVGLADVIAGVREQQREARDRCCPRRPLAGSRRGRC